MVRGTLDELNQPVHVGTDAGNDSLSKSKGQLRYVLITPARNEEAFIEKTIQSVIKQTVLPLKWVIVDDGSTDKTPGIVSRHLGQISLD